MWSNEKKQRGCQATKQHVYYRVYICAKRIAAIQRTSEQQMQDTPVLLRYLTYLRILTGEVFIVAKRQQSMCDSDLYQKMNISSTYFTRVVIIQCLFLLLDPLDRREHKPVFLFLEIMYCTFGRIPHWYHSKCRLMSGNLFKHFLSIQKLSRHHAESVSDSVQIASIKSESFWERKWVEQMHEINGFAWFWYIFWSRVGLVAFFFNSPSQGKRFI